MFDKKYMRKLLLDMYFMDEDDQIIEIHLEEPLEI